MGTRLKPLVLCFFGNIVSTELELSACLLTFLNKFLSIVFTRFVLLHHYYQLRHHYHMTLLAMKIDFLLDPD